jgi:hypothetical protein
VIVQDDSAEERDTAETIFKKKIKKREKFI